MSSCSATDVGLRGRRQPQRGGERRMLPRTSRVTGRAFAVLSTTSRHELAAPRATPHANAPPTPELLSARSRVRPVTPSSWRGSALSTRQARECSSPLRQELPTSRCRSFSCTWQSSRRTMIRPPVAAAAVVLALAAVGAVRLTQQCSPWHWRSPSRDSTRRRRLRLHPRREVWKGRKGAREQLAHPAQGLRLHTAPSAKRVTGQLLSMSMSGVSRARG